MRGKHFGEEERNKGGKGREEVRGEKEGKEEKWKRNVRLEGGNELGKKEIK